MTDYAVVISRGLNFHTAPTASAKYALDRGTRLELLGPTHPGQQAFWRQVRVVNTGAEGWVAEYRNAKPDTKFLRIGRNVVPIDPGSSPQPPDPPFATGGDPWWLMVPWWVYVIGIIAITALGVMLTSTYW